MDAVTCFCGREARVAVVLHCAVLVCADSPNSPKFGHNFRPLSRPTRQAITKKSRNALCLVPPDARLSREPLSFVRPMWQTLS